jgi:short-subunit dehydrogenase
MSRPVALVTGASAGIGVEFAKQLAPLGYDLVLVARRRDRLDALAAELTASSPGLRAHVLVADLALPEAPAEIAAELARRSLDVDLLVNNAGFGWHGRFVKSDPDNAARMIAVNVGALVALSNAFVPAMVARKRGGVINVGSTASFQPVPNMAVYGATKAFVLSFTEALHEEVRASGVSVVALCPGATTTEFFAVAGDFQVPGPKRTSADVVRTALRALAKNQAVVVDGPINQGMSASVRFLPRSVVRRAAASLMRVD